MKDFRNLYIRANGKTYHAGMIADELMTKNPDLRETEEYENTIDELFDRTGACNRKEQRDWMLYYMIKAIELDAAGLRMLWGTNDKRGKQQRRYAKALFMAAYDLIEK